VAERHRVLLAAPLLAATLLLAGCGGAAGDGAAVTGVRTEDGDGMHGVVLDAPYTLADATLTDTAGEPFGLRDALEREVTLVFFGYSHCPDICQVVMADLASTVARLSEADAERVAVWFVTTDPARDDATTLRTYLDRFDPGFEGVTGPLPTIVEVARSMHVPIEKGPRLDTGGYDVTHGTPILAVTPEGEVPMLWTEGTSAAKLAEDVTTLLADGVPARNQES
jgi:protein SCO1